MTKVEAIELLRKYICNGPYSVQTGKPSPIFGMCKDSNKIRLFRIDTENHNIDEITSLVSTACGLTYKDNDGHGYIHRKGSGYGKVQDCVEEVARVLGVDFIPAKTL